MATPQISLHVKITVAPENAEAFLEALKPCYEAVIAEPKCTFFEVFLDGKERGVFKFVESWDASPEWLTEVQLKKEYYHPYLAATEPMFIKPREMEIWSRVPGGKFVHVRDENFK